MSKSRSKKTLHYILITFVIFLTILFIIYNETQVRQASQLEIDNHAKILTQALWSLDIAQAKPYVDQAIRNNDYEKFQIRYSSGGIFLNDESNKDSNVVESLLEKMGLITVLDVVSPLIYKGEPIGTLDVSIKIKSVYLNIYAIILSALLILAIRQHFKILIAKDRLDQKVVERTKELVTSDKKYRELFEYSPIGLALCSVDGTLVSVNASYAQIVGYGIDEVLKLSYWEITPEKYAGEDKLQLEKLEKDGIYGPYEKEYRHKDGHLVAVRLNGMIVERNKQKYIWSSVEDISSLKEAEGKAHQALVRLDQVKTEFISTAAHELRTPLASIMGFTEFVRHPEEFGGFSKKQIDEFLDEIYERGEALNLIIDDLLDFSRIESGHGVDLNVKNGYLGHTINKSANLHRINNHDQFLVIDFSKDCFEEQCVFDHHRIMQVTDNLLSNAFKYSPPKSEILLSCYLEPDRWVVSVKDNGEGMTPEQTERVFEKFYRADASDTAVSGLGLGLSIAKKIIVTHNGEIWVESSKGKGTTAIFTLPRMQG